MVSAVVSALAAPIREVASLVGPGWSGDHPLDRAHDTLADVAVAVRRAWGQAEADWSGAGADAAAEFAAATAATTEALAARVAAMDATAQTVGQAVAHASERLRAIVERFEARAAALEPYLGSPTVEKELVAEAQRSLTEAVAVVDELRAELVSHATALTAPDSPAATTLAAAPTPSMGSGLGGGAPISPMSNTGGASGWGGLGELVKFASREDLPPDAASFGDGVAVALPDGSSALAPNALAASAVRHAMTQLGVPYQWGGTSPGIGLDCSGLTQWAYHEAGLDIPRLAQEQDIGTAVDADSLRPGDLAVWDGHVAMIVGNGTMIEAGDPVQLSPIRTTNAGQGFQGFWRPTA